MPFRPAARMVSSGKPGLRHQPRFHSAFGSHDHDACALLPARAASHSRATASAGKTWPPVPPPAISRRFLPVTPACCAHALVRVLADIQEHARSQQHAKQARSAVADERQRNAFGRQQAEHHAEIDQRLADDHGGDAHAPEICRNGREPSWRRQSRASRKPQTASARSTAPMKPNSSQMMA